MKRGYTPKNTKIRQNEIFDYNSPVKEKNNTSENMIITPEDEKTNTSENLIITTEAKHKTLLYNTSNNMSLTQIQGLEKNPLFKIFLKKIWFKSYSEYIDLFWNRRDEREKAVKRFLDTYNA